MAEEVLDSIMKVKVLVGQSCPILCDPMDCSLQASSVEFSRQEYWSRLPFPSPEDLPNPEIEPRSPTLQADSLPAESPCVHTDLDPAMRGKKGKIGTNDRTVF